MPVSLDVVVDLGCATHGGEESVLKLVKRFHPRTLYGFDPWPEMDESTSFVDETLVLLSRKAAWRYDGMLSYRPCTPSTASSYVSTLDGTITVRCFDFGHWVYEKGLEDFVLKMDVEGSEYVILELLRSRGLDERISLLLVEWHDHLYEGYPRMRERLEHTLKCPIELWS